MRILCWLVLSVLVRLLAPASAAAQSRTSLAVDAAISAGRGTGGEFRNRKLTGARLAGSIRRVPTAGIGMFAEFAAEWPSITQGETAVCYFNPRGGCLPVYPSLSGTTAVIGLIAKPAGWIEAQAGLGAGVLSGVGAAVATGSVAIFPVRRIGLLGGARWFAVPRFRGDRLGVVPWTIGIRLR